MVEDRENEQQDAQAMTTTRTTRILRIYWVARNKSLEGIIFSV
jgi:hypothetical protein